MKKEFIKKPTFFYIILCAVNFIVLSAIADEPNSLTSFDCQGKSFVDAAFSTDKTNNSSDNTRLLPFVLPDNWNNNVGWAPSTHVKDLNAKEKTMVPLKGLANNGNLCQKSYDHLYSTYPWLMKRPHEVAFERITLNNRGILLIINRFCNSNKEDHLSDVQNFYSILHNNRDEDLHTKLLHCLTATGLSAITQEMSSYFGYELRDKEILGNLRSYINKNEATKFLKLIKEVIKENERIGTVKSLNSGYTLSLETIFNGQAKIFSSTGANVFENGFRFPEVLKSEELRKYLYESYFQHAQETENLLQFERNNRVKKELSAKFTISTWANNFKGNFPLNYISSTNLMIDFSNSNFFNNQIIRFGDGHVVIAEDSLTPEGKKKSFSERRFQVDRLPIYAKEHLAWSFLEELESQNLFFNLPKQTNPISNQGSALTITQLFGTNLNPHITSKERAENTGGVISGYIALFTRYLTKDGKILVDLNGRPCKEIESKPVNSDLKTTYTCPVYLVEGLTAENMN